MEKLVFSHSIEGYLRAVRPVLDSALTEELQALGVDPTKPLLPAYPVDVLRNALVVGARRLSPGKSDAEALVALGHRYVEGYGETMVGRALKTAIRLIGPRRTLERLAKQFRTANNYSETKVTHHGPGRSELWCNDVTHPSWYVGLVAGTLGVAGGKDVKVSLRSHDAAGAVFDVEWRD
ncbi:MAG: DUF2378 family protein [Myxococcaceae bacterium]|nr:DUF2378 family protein [Myxococcaceae bacterium]